MSENLIIDQELEEHRSTLNEISNLFKNKNTYQTLIFIILSIGIWGGSLMIDTFPSQKHLPVYV
jgi:hypothetical protein